MRCSRGSLGQAPFQSSVHGHSCIRRKPVRCNVSLAAQQKPVAHPSIAAIGHEAKAIGTLLGAMSGNVLGAPFENDRHYRITRMHPQGVLEFWHFDLAEHPVPYGHYTGDFSTMLAVAKSLNTSSRANVFDIAGTLAASYQEPYRRYNPYAQLILQSLRTFPDLYTLPQLAHDFLAHTTQRVAQSASNRAEREPWGWADNGAAVRVAPVGLAYRNAPADVLKQAVESSLVFSHTHELGRDGALVQAAAVAFISRLDPSDEVSSHPAILLEHLLEVAETDDMRSKLKLMLRGLMQLEEVRDFSSFFSSKQWHDLSRMANFLSYQNYATVGTEAAAIALWCLCTSWQHPRQAVSMAVHLGGSTPVTACMTGALAGALHGCDWIPGSWYDNLENGFGGRDDVVEAARQLSELDCADVAPLQPSNEEAEAMLEQLGQQWEGESKQLLEQMGELEQELKKQAQAAAAQS